MISPQDAGTGDQPNLTREQPDHNVRHGVRAGAPHSQTLDRGLRVLETLAAQGRPQTIAQLAAALGVHRSIVYRILRTLTDHRLVRRTPDGTFELGLGLPALARSVSEPLQTAALPELSELANEVGMTAFLVVPEHEEAVTLVSVEPRHSTAHVSYRPGVRHPVNRGAPGLALLAGGPPRPQERAEVTRARREGFARSEGEVLAGMTAVAAPVLDRAGTVRASVAVVFVDTGADAAALGNRVAAAARNVTAELA